MRLFLDYRRVAGTATVLPAHRRLAGAARTENTMQTPEKTSTFLETSRADAATLHQTIEAGIAQGETRMHATLQQASDKAREIATTLKTKAATADSDMKAHLLAAATHADAVVRNGLTNRPRPMLDEAKKLSHSISEAVAHVRANGESGAKK
jgi:hypothetical protein